MRSPLVLLALAAVIGAVILFVESPVALSFVLTEGAPAVAILALAAVPGTLILRAIGVGADGDGGGRVACHVIFGLGLGVGLLCLLELTLGVCGHLERGVWVAIFGAMTAAAILAYGGALRRAYAARTKVELRPISGWHWVWLAVVPFAATAMLVATAPPGVLWPEEGNGYDVLEYHLAVPKAYYEAGRIGFLPNNVYSNFPMNAEMLYLLAMVLRGGAIEGIMPAQVFNALLAFLTVAAVWAAARPFGPRTALFAAVLAGTCGWLVYLSGVAYVENAMLLFTALALGAVVRAGVGAGASRWALLAGVFAGLACGCKYTAVVLVAIPLGLVILAQTVIHVVRHRRAAAQDPSPGSQSSALRPVGCIRTTLLFALGAFATFGPWLLKNAVFCGNPVFPLATTWLGYRPDVWDSASEARWRTGHQPPLAARSAAGRVGAVWSGVMREPRTGLLLWGLATVAWLLERRRRWALAAIVGMQVLLWAGTTTLVERFAVPVLPPLFVLAATAVCGREREAGAFAGAVRADSQTFAGSPGSMETAGARRTAVVCTVVLIAAAFSLYRIGRLYYYQSRILNADGSVARLSWHGQTEWLLGGQWPGTAHWGFINGELPRDARVLLVGDARSLYVQRKCGYTVVFNANPLAAAAGPDGDAVAALGWLRRSGWTHVYVDWMEMERLRATYGFWPGIDEVLFTELAKLGLEERKNFAANEGGVPYGTIYEVPK